VVLLYHISKLKNNRTLVLVSQKFLPEFTVKCGFFIRKSRKYFTSFNGISTWINSFIVFNSFILFFYNCCNGRSVLYIFKILIRNLLAAEKIQKLQRCFLVIAGFWDKPLINPEVGAFFRNRISKVVIFQHGKGGFTGITEGNACFLTNNGI